MYDFIPVVPVCRDNGTKGDILTALNNFNVGFAGTTPQLYGLSPYQFDINYI